MARLYQFLMHGFDMSSGVQEYGTEKTKQLLHLVRLMNTYGIKVKQPNDHLITACAGERLHDPSECTGGQSLPRRTDVIHAR